MSLSAWNSSLRNVFVIYAVLNAGLTAFGIWLGWRIYRFRPSAEEAAKNFLYVMLFWLVLEWYTFGFALAATQVEAALYPKVVWDFVLCIGTYGQAFLALPPAKPRNLL